MASVSVIVAPRERYSSVIETLQELFQTVPVETPIIVVEGGSPPHVKRKLSRLKAAHNFAWVSEPTPITPNRARNLGLQNATTKYVVFVDNDILFEPGWLDYLVARAEQDEADVVAPMICIGPPRAHLIHHAGGVLTVDNDHERPVIKESHRLMNVPIKDFSELDAPPENEVCEFHCALVRRDLFGKIGALDERLITREQMDFALRCKLVNATVRFEKKSIVTYSAKERFRRRDVMYHLFRWSDELAVRSLDAFEQSWDTRLDRDRIRYRWIQSHRRRAILGAFPTLRLLPERLRKHIVRFLERAATKGVLPPLESCEVPAQPARPAHELVQLRSEQER